MSLEEKIGQMFLVRYDSAEVNDEIKFLYPGGYVMFAKDFENETKESIKDKIKKYQRKSSIP